MKKMLYLLASFLVFESCTTTQKATYILNTESLKIHQIAKNVFVHISYLHTDDYGKVACNGMIYFNTNEAIVFDTPTNDVASIQLINWITKEKEKSINAVVVTHFHEDCLGGLNAFHKSGNQSYSSQRTIALARQANVSTLPLNGFEDNLDITIGQEQVLIRHFGEGHTQDNVVGYLPKEKVLFGGCLIKSLNSSKGYLGDANTQAWPYTVRLLKAQLPNIKHVIPGHGQPGNTDLLDYTIALFSN